ncbi:MAG: sigma-70 family RNA polymerase sigma factor [Prevotella sp.]|nr:sigma-70 family RNA polymerase sigma factor [Alistipes senegalensis]MCM1358569.1 sigma-70 family RNA polymerase sigma factor [Prevotella sp.]
MSIDLRSQYDKIYRYCYIRVQNREKAEDLTQETFLRFLEKPQYHNQNKDLQYLYTIAGNLCIDEYRKKSTEELPEELPDSSCNEEIILNSVALSTALEKLSEEDREIILLRYVNEEPVGVISRLYNISRFALNRRIKKILEFLRSEFEREDFK